MVQIKIENRRDNIGALKIIDENINNLKEKVECLKQYVPKLLKNEKNGQKTSIILKEDFSKRIL